MKNARRTLVALVVLFPLLLAMLALPSVSLASTYSAQEVAFLDQINQYRQQNGLSTLLLSDALSDAARKHNSDMAKYSFFAHNTVQSDFFAANATPWDRMAACGYTYNTYKGENIAAGYSTAQAVFTAWRNSAGHNQNMLNPNFKVIGISLLDVPGSAYRYYWTTDFGGYVDPTAHAGSTSTSGPTTTLRPTTTTGRPATTTTQPTTTITTVRPTTTTLRPATTTTAPQPTTTTSRPWSWFWDVRAGSPYFRAITALQQADIVEGYPVEDHREFRPDDPLNRAQFAKLVCGAFGIEVDESLIAPFADLGIDDPSTLYPHDYIAAAATAGITRGVNADRYNPWGGITRAQVITMIVRAIEEYSPEALKTVPSNFAPTLPLTGDAVHDESFRVAEYNGLLQGLEPVGPNWNLWDTASRGEAAQILWNGMQRI